VNRESIEQAPPTATSPDTATDIPRQVLYASGETGDLDIVRPGNLNSTRIRSLQTRMYDP
jgi:hypothetical protein